MYDDCTKTISEDDKPTISRNQLHKQMHDLAHSWSHRLDLVKARAEKAEAELALLKAEKNGL